jgi:hypothetical protein
MTLPGDRRLARSHLERAYELDPSLRPDQQPSSSGALDAATEESIIARALRAVRTAAAPRRATKRTPPMFDSNKLFQLRPGDPGYREPRSRRHALDATEPDGAREHLEHARRHVSLVADGNAELDVERLRGYLDRALEALGEEPEGEDDREDGRLHKDQVTDPVGHGGPPTIRRGHEEEGADTEEDDEREFGPRLGDRRRARDEEELGETPAVSAVSTRDRRRRARDAMGETPARSSVSLKGLRRRVDHRDDFRDVASGGAESGADSRHGHDSARYDEAALFQTSATR